MIIIVESGGANIASIQFCLERLGAEARLSCDIDIIKKASHIILPGVGSAACTIRRLQDNHLLSTLRSLTQPVLGICLGMQLLFDFSEEGDVPCLGIIPGTIKKMTGFQDNQEKLPLPHMGWNKIEIKQHNSLMKNVPHASYVYFVHSYAAPINPYTNGITQYGEAFSSMVQFNNFYGTQFHPERSGDVGAQIIKNFLEL